MIILILIIPLHCKKDQRFPLPNSPWPGIIKLFPARESLVGDIPAGDGKTANLFYSVVTLSMIAKYFDYHDHVMIFQYSNNIFLWMLIAHSFQYFDMTFLYKADHTMTPAIDNMILPQLWSCIDFSIPTWSFWWCWSYRWWSSYSPASSASSAHSWSLLMKKVRYDVKSLCVGRLVRS